MVQNTGGCSLYFPIRLHCATVADALTNPELEDALVRALGRAFAHARTALPTAVAVGDGVALQPPQLMKGDLSTNDATALLARVSRAIEAAARVHALPLNILAPVAAEAGTANVAEAFDPRQYVSVTGTYDVPSYKGRRQKVSIKDNRRLVKVESKGKKRQRFATTDEMRNALEEDRKSVVEERIKEEHLTLTILSATSYETSWQFEDLRHTLVLWTYTTFFTPDKPPKDAERKKKLKEIEQSIVTPFLLKFFRKYYTFASALIKNVPIPPEMEYAALPDEVQGVVEGRLTGWLKIRDQIADSLSPDMRHNLVLFYGWASEGKGKMAKIKIWSDLKDEAIVHQDLVDELKKVADKLTELAPVLKKDFSDFWKHRSALGLQIRHIGDSSSLSAHALGKAIDVAATYNPRLKDPRLLSEIEGEAGVEKWEIRQSLLIQQRKALAEDEEMSEQFKQFLKEARENYQQWIRAQKVFREVFPTVRPEDDPALVLKETIERVKARHVEVTKKLSAATVTLENAKRTIQNLEVEQQRLKAQVQQLAQSLQGIVQQIRRLKKHPPSLPETKDPSERPMTAEDAERRRAEIIEEEKQARARLKALPSLVKEGRKAVSEADKDLKKMTAEEALLGKLSQDLVSDPLLLFRTGVVDPGLATIKERGFLNVPWEVVQVFLEHGFDWGGFWTHPDFMEFQWAGLVSGEEPHKKKK